MPNGLNRALLVRTANRLRASLARDELSGLPLVAALSDADQWELLEVGCGRLATITLRLESPGGEEVQRLALREVARMVDEQVRRTDLLGWLDASTLLVLAPGLEPQGGRSLVERLRKLLASCRVSVGGAMVDVHVAVGVAYRSGASPAGWTPRNLASEAEVNAA